MFRSSTITGELVLSLAKVILKHSVKLCPYRLCGGVAACLGVGCVLCAVQNETEYKNVFATSHYTHCVFSTNTKRLMLFWEVIAVYCENHT
jgi:hypothetical protein